MLKAAELNTDAQLRNKYDSSLVELGPNIKVKPKNF